MRYINLILGISLLFISATTLSEDNVESSAEQKAVTDISPREIMYKVNELDMGDNVIQEQSMTVIDDKGNSREQRSKSFRKKMENGDETRSITFFTYPNEIKNTGFLTYDYKNSDKDDRRWMYLPKLRKIKRIASKDKRLSFMQSDFSHADLSIRNVDAYQYKLIGEEDLEGHKVWVIESTPKDEETISENGYIKNIFYVRQDVNVIVRSINYLKKGKRIKTMNVSKLENIQGYWVLKEITMETSKSGEVLSKTILRIDNILFDQDIPHNQFSTHALERGL
jgi:hypothetical protein